MSSLICPSCGRRTAKQRVIPEYRYRECGLTEVVLCGGVIETHCAHCEERSIAVPGEWQVLQLIALALLTTQQRLTGQQMKYLRGACDLSQAALAKTLRKRRETVAERESQLDPRISEAEEMWFRLAILEAFNQHLADPKRNYLAAVHIKALRTFAAEFSKTALSIAEREHRQLPLRLRLTGALWKATGRAA